MEISDETSRRVAEAIRYFLRRIYTQTERRDEKFIEKVLPDLAENARDGGVVARLMAPHLNAQPVHRLWTAIYCLTLKGEAEGLEGYFPSLERADFEFDAEPGPGWRAIRTVLAEKEGQIARLMELPIQYHAPFRAAPLTAALFWFRQRTDLPFRLREVGSSGGFLLRPDRYGYFADGRWYGDPDSRLKLEPAWRGANFESQDLNIISRAGCDLQPIDTRDPESRIRLMASVIPTPLVAEQFHAAFKVAESTPPVTVQQESAETWVPRELAQDRDGVADVLVRSWVDYQLPRDVRKAVNEAVSLRGQRATQRNPFMEVTLANDSGHRSEALRLRIWGGDGCTSAVFRTWKPGRDPFMHQPVYDLSRGIIGKHPRKGSHSRLSSMPPPKSRKQGPSFGI